MAVKEIIRAARSAPEYAGLAIFSGEQLIYAEGIEPGYVLRLLLLSRRVRGPVPAGAGCVCAVAAGFTFYVYDDGGFSILLRLAGRFRQRPEIALIESDYLDPLADSLLPDRGAIHLEALALLRQYELLK